MSAKESSTVNTSTRNATLLVVAMVALWLLLFTIGTVVPSSIYRNQIRESIGENLGEEKVRSVESPGAVASTSSRSPSAGVCELVAEACKEISGQNAARASKPRTILTAPQYIGHILIIVVSWTWSNLLLLCVSTAVIGVIAGGTRTGSIVDNPVQRGLVRGLFIYLTILAGNIIFMGGFADVNNPQEATRFQYFRLAGFGSLLSFMSGFSPAFFIRVTRLLERQFLTPLEKRDDEQAKK